MLANSSAINVSNVGFHYGSAVVLRDVRLSIRAGEHVAIVGRSGAGKSTLLQLIVGLLKPDKGEIRIDDAPVTGPVLGATLMFQRPALLPWASVADNVVLPLRFSGALRRDRGGARSKVLALLDQVGLADRAEARPAELSGGQQQRVALARALASEPRILLLDEPFSALDPEMRAGLRADVRRLAQERGVTLVAVAHDLADVASLAERAIVLGGVPSRVIDDLPLGSDAATILRARMTNLSAVA